MHQPIFRSSSVTELHGNMGLPASNHPLITVIDTANLEYGAEYVGMRFTTDMYCVAFKDGGCSIDYGLKAYDFSDGNLFFSAPEQVFTVTKAQQKNQVKGWMLYFHPQLIQPFPLGKSIDYFSFFNYESSLALKLESDEEQLLQQLVNQISSEINQQGDQHTDTVIVNLLELLFSYCNRYFQRQSESQEIAKTDVLSQVERSLKSYYQDNDLSEAGQPTIQYLAEQCHITTNYLSDILTKQTGRSAKEHINDFLIEKAKHLLLSQNINVAQVAYQLRFNYPHYFTRLFKQKTSMTPQQFRQQNND